MIEPLDYTLDERCLPAPPATPRPLRRPAPGVAVVFWFDCSECAECADASNSSQIQLDRESVSQVPAYGFSLRVPRVAVVKRVALILAVYCLLRTTRA